MRSLAKALCAVWLFGAAPNAESQTIGIDVAFAPRMVWRGVTRTGASSLQPRVWGAHTIGPHTVAVGASAIVELGERDADGEEFTIRGRDDTWVSATDVWAEVRGSYRSSRAVLGVLRSDFLGTALGDGIPRGESGTELYLAMESMPSQPIVERVWYRLRYWYGVGGADAQYFEATLAKQLLLVPLQGAITVTFQGTAGYNFAAPSTLGRRGALTYAARGITHTELAAILNYTRLCELAAVSAQLSLHHEFARDELARRVSPTALRSVFQWIRLSLSPTSCTHHK